MCEGAWPLSKLSYTNSVRLGSVDAEWITMKKDWQEAKKRSKAQQKEHRSRSRHPPGDDARGDDKPAAYDPEMDKMRCILYAHGGQYCSSTSYVRAIRRCKRDHRSIEPLEVLVYFALFLLVISDLSSADICNVVQQRHVYALRCHSSARLDSVVWHSLLARVV